ncbi:MAG: Gfo/Idh/MocA family oxidoreductase [Anaerolineales bacterium]
MRFLIAGLGSVGRRHLRNLNALGELDILLHRSGKSTLPDSEVAGFPTYPDLEEALDQNPDAVIVATPTSLHVPVALAAARRGYAVLIEKPVSHTLEGTVELVHTIQSTGAPTLIGYQYRFHPGIQGMRQAVAQGRIGRPEYARATYGDFLPAWHPWEDFRASYSARRELGGGVLLTLSHPLDYLCWIFGEPVIRWSWLATLSDWPIDVEDTAEVGLAFSTGAVASVHLDFLQRPSSHRLEIVGSEGTLEWNQASGEWRIYSPEQDRWVSGEGAGVKRNQMFLAEIEHFRSVARREVAPLCGLEDGLRTLRLALGARSIGEAPSSMRDF